MRNIVWIIVLSFSINSSAQNNPLGKFGILIGNWEGTGTGFNSTQSIIQTEFNWIMNQRYIEVKNRSEFQPTIDKSQAEIHEDIGMISYDKARGLYIFRQFHVEGFVNQYFLNDSLSIDGKLVFESEVIENFVSGGNARFTIIVKNETEIETLFDVGFPGKEMACFGHIS